MEMSSSDVKIEKKSKLLQKYTYIKTTLYIIEKLSLIKVCSLNKENSRELLDCWLLFCLFYRLGSRFE